MNRKQFLLPALARELPKADRLNFSRLLASYDRASVAETVDCEAVAGGGGLSFPGVATGPWNGSRQWLAASTLAEPQASFPSDEMASAWLTTYSTANRRMTSLIAQRRRRSTECGRVGRRIAAFGTSHSQVQP
jgi:hypothetical protein